MKATAFLAAVGTLAFASAAIADPEVFSVQSVTTNDTGTITEDFTIDNYVWGSTDFIDSLPNNGTAGFFNIEVMSGDSDRPGWDYALTLDYTDYDIGFFDNDANLDTATHSISLLGVKDTADPNIITDVTIKTTSGGTLGTISTDGFNIFFAATVSEVLDAIGPDRNQVLTIQFSQIPGPGALALLGVAGLAARRRRRSA